MKKVIDKDCINMLIIPLSENQAISLENHLHTKVVEARSKNEFVWVGHIPDVNGASMISFGVNKVDKFNKKRRVEIEKQLIHHGREWMREHGFIRHLH